MLPLDVISQWDIDCNTHYVDLDEAVTLCECGERYYWKIGDEAFQCGCGIFYFRNASPRQVNRWIWENNL